MRKVAEYELEKGNGRIENWWATKYKLPPNHELFRNRSIASLHIEMIKDLLIQREKVEKDISTSHSGDALRELTEQLNLINKALNPDIENTSGDDLIDKWEKELAEGKTPNLNEGFKNA